jgi:hypothetical protein
MGSSFHPEGSAGIMVRLRIWPFSLVPSSYDLNYCPSKTVIYANIKDFPDPESVL